MARLAIEPIPCKFLLECVYPDLNPYEAEDYEGENYSPLYTKAYKKYLDKHNFALEDVFNRMAALRRVSIDAIAHYAVLFDLALEENAVSKIDSFNRQGYLAEAIALYYLFDGNVKWPTIPTDLYLVNDFSEKEIAGFSNITLQNLRTYYDVVRYGAKYQIAAEFLKADWDTVGKVALLEEATSGSPRKVYELAKSDIPVTAWKDLRDAPVEWLKALAGHPIPEPDDDDF